MTGEEIPKEMKRLVVKCPGYGTRQVFDVYECIL